MLEHSLDIGGQIFYHIHTSCDKHCVATLHYKYKLRVKSKDSERSHGNPTNTMYVTFHTVNFNTANKLFTLNLTYNATPCHIVYDCGKKVGHLRSNNYHILYWYDDVHRILQCGRKSWIEFYILINVIKGFFHIL